MADHVPVSAAWLVELASRRGLALPPDRAETLRPTLESLLGRLAAFPGLIPPAVAPPPTPAPE